ncbi:MAG: NUDIX hydrolase [Candidatus Sumerlaeota bacterium]|nr:NUDIX hydrolase [Candidatus Sumerlaeota bacterium]
MAGAIGPAPEDGGQEIRPAGSGKMPWRFSKRHGQNDARIESGKAGGGMADEAFHLERIDPAEGLPRAVLYRLRRAGGAPLYCYEFLHPALAATVALFDREREAFLLALRERAPYAGCYCFPGGFIQAGREDIYEAAARELREETGARVARERLQLVDIRSRPDRDPRDHVIDVGFYAEVDRVEAEALDETSAIRWAKAEEMDSLPLAFDHAELWAHVKRMRLRREDYPDFQRDLENL